MLKKLLAVFPVFIFFAFSGLFVFASPSSPVVFQSSRLLTTEQKQDLTWRQIKSELRNRYTYFDLGEEHWKPLLDAAKDDAQYAKEGSELEQEVKNLLLSIFATAEKNRIEVPKVLHPTRVSSLSQQKWRWNSLVDVSVGEQQDALLNPKYAYLAKTPISIKKEVYESLEPLFIAAKRFGVLETWEEFAEIKIPGFRKMIWDFYYLFSVWDSDINDALTAADAKNKPKLDNLWTAIKDELKKPEYDKWKNTSIKIKNKSYDLKLLFAAAKEKGDVKGSALPLDAKLQLQELLNDQVTSKMIENQLLALNQARKEKDNLVIVLATGGGVFVAAAGLGGFLYWFFKIRK